jgi:NAD(P)-dependent dehydrogenase (short-subunit alcohol dehydrogenase family)
VGSDAWARSTADGLADRGWTVECVAAATTVESSIAALTAARSRIGRPTLVVHVPSRPVVAGRFVDLGPLEWDELCEAPLRAALFTAIATHRMFAADSGRLVFLLPLADLAGRDGSAAFGAALEGIRGLAKSAARRWGRDGVTVNCVAFIADRGEVGGLSRWRPALDRDVDVHTDVTGVVELLTTAAAKVVTGATIMVDGGIVMAP